MLTFYGIERNLNMWAAKGWGLKLDIADECAWSAELRITTDTSVNEGKCDISTVFLSCGHVCPQDAANAVYADAFAHFREQERPQDDMSAKRFVSRSRV